MKYSWLLVWLFWTGAVAAQPAPGLVLEIVGPPVAAVAKARPGCDATDIPDAPARAIHLADGTVQLYATNSRNRIETGPDLLHVVHRCAILLTGAGNDDPAAYDDRAWIASPWSRDGRTIFAVMHNEFHGHRRAALCPSQRYMDCWFNALTEAVSHDKGRTFQRIAAGPAAVVAALPYRFDEVGIGHHGYFNPSGIVSLNGTQYMFTFATRAGAQRSGNCLLRTTDIGVPGAWRAWGGARFDVAFIDPYRERGPPEGHICAPVALNGLRWPVTALVRHGPTGLFVAMMQNGARGGGIFYATSPDLLTWSDPALLLPTLGEGAWSCSDPPPLAFPSLLDPASGDRNFEKVSSSASLYAVRFNISNCRTSLDRELVRWPVTIRVR